MEPVDMSTIKPEVIVSLKHRAEPLKRVLGVLKDILTDVNILFKPGEVYIAGIDPEKLVASELILFQFEEYSCVEPDVRIGVYLAYLYKMLRGVGPSHLVEMTIERSTPNVLGILVTDPEKDTRSFTAVKSMEIPLEHVSIPDVDFDSVVSVPTRDLQKALRETSLISTRVCLGYTLENRIQLISSGPVGVANITLGPNNNGLTWYKKTEDSSHGLYFNKFIQKVVRPDVSAMVDISFKKGFPLMFQFSDKDYLGVFRFAIAEIAEPT